MKDGEYALVIEVGRDVEEADFTDVLAGRARV